jgi:enolase
VVEVKDISGVLSYTSRGSPTIDIILRSNRGFVGRYSSPSGASVGKREAPMFPNNNVDEALELLDILARRLVGFSYEKLSELDMFVEEFDGTGGFYKIGSALSLGISVAGAELAANEEDMPLFYWLSNGHPTHLPIPLGNVVGGGKHSLGRSIDIQEILVFPSNAKSYREALDAIMGVHREVAKLLAEKDRYFNGGKNDEGAWTTSLDDEEAIGIVRVACDTIEDDTGVKLHLGLDVAASSLWDVELSKYYYPRRKLYMDGEEQFIYISELIEKFDIKYIEDPFMEDDFRSFAMLVKEWGDKVYIVGDDLLVTNKSRISLGISNGSCNGVIIKPNQVGNLTRTMEAVDEAGRGNLLIVVSHRSGETPYPHLSHIALGLGAHLFKAGIVGGERIVKHNELLMIEELYGGLKPISIKV